MADLTAHSFADIFPRMSGEEYEALKADIAAHGLREPIVLHEGRIVDGRNRYRACRELKIEPPTREWSVNGSLVDYIVSVNLHRRHLTPSQKGMVAAEIEPLLAAEAKERQREQAKRNQPQADRQKVETLPPIEKAKARDKAAKLTGTNPRYVSDAKTVKKKAPDLAEKVRSGEMTLPKAKAEASRREATKNLPGGKTPTEQAREDPGVRWAGFWHDLRRTLNSIRRLGGMKVLAKRWTAAQRRQYAKELRETVEEIQTWLTEMETASE